MNYAAFLTYFRRMIDHKTEWESVNSSARLDYPIYDDQMKEFAETFRRSEDYDPHYRQTLHSAEIVPKVDHETMGEVMLANDPNLTKAMLSMIIDGEKLHKGTWADALREGFFFQLLSALCPATVIA